MTLNASFKLGHVQTCIFKPVSSISILAEFRVLTAHVAGFGGSVGVGKRSGGGHRLTFNSDKIGDRNTAIFSASAALDVPTGNEVAEACARH